MTSQGCLYHPPPKDTLDSAIRHLQRELNLYKQALTKAISLPKGILPHTEAWYTWMNNGNCVIESMPNKSIDS